MCRKVGPWNNAPIVEDRQGRLVRGVAGRRVVRPAASPEHPVVRVKVVRLVREGRHVGPVDLEVAQVAGRTREGHVIRVDRAKPGNHGRPAVRRFPRA